MIAKVFFALLILMAASGCLVKSSGSSAGQRADYEISADMKIASPVSNGEPKPSPENLNTIGEKKRKLIRQATFHLQAPDPEAVEAPVLAAMNKYGAYSATTEIHENSRSYTIRVPETSFQPLLDELDELKVMGRLLYRSESAEDVTLNYYDLEGRLQTKQELRTTFQRYLETAKTMEDIMAVETRIMELQNEIDWMGTELRSLSHLVEYATITLEIRRHPLAPSYAKPTLADRIGGLFGSFGDYAAAVLLILLGIIIYGIPGVVILVLLYWLLLGKIGLLKKLWRIAAGKGRQP
jgi:hypothetical protein